MDDYFVGGVSVILGLVITSAAIFNWNWSYQLTKTKWLEGKLGRNATRSIYAIIGLGLVALGGYIIL